jgi:hypothetical protein
MLLGCTCGGGCLVRGAAAGLREPSLRGRPYDPAAPLAARLDRYDNEPWHLWDMRPAGAAAPAGLVPALLALGEPAHRGALQEALPLVLPSLGLLVPLGIRLRMRLDCALRLATQAPALLAAASSRDVYTDVYRICRGWEI